MRFDPASACLWIDTDRATLRAMLKEVEQGTKVTGVDILTTYSSTWIPIVAAMPINHRHLICRMRHELDHLRRHLGTSFGLFYHFMNSSFPPIFFEVASLLAAKGKLDFPLFNPSFEKICKAVGYAEFAKQSDEAAAFAYWNSAKELLRVLDGDPALVDSEIALLRLNNALSSMADRPQSVTSRWQEKLDKPLRPYLNKSNPALPQWQGVPFGGRHVLEALGYGVEASFALLTGIDPVLIVEGMDEGHYGLITQIWSSLVDEAPSQPPKPGATTAPMRSLAYMAAVDLALWIPIGPEGLVEGTSELSWSDVHPGWRFLKICNAVQQLDLSDLTIELEVEKTNEPFRVLQNRICNTLGWPPVDKIALAWLKLLGKQLDSETYSGFFWETGRAHPRVMSSVALLSRRLIAPYQIAFNYFDFTSIKSMFFPILFVRDGHLIYAADQAIWAHFQSPEFRRAMPFFVHHGVRKLAEGKEVAPHMGPDYDAATLNYMAAHAQPFGVDPNIIRSAAAKYFRC